MNQEQCYRYNLMQVPVLHVVPFIWYTKTGGWCLLFLRIRDVLDLCSLPILLEYCRMILILEGVILIGIGYSSSYELS